MLNSLKELIIRERFCPSSIGIFLSHFYLSRRGIARSMEKYAPKLEGRILDIGCGTRPYEKLFTACTEYVGVEIDTPDTRQAGYADFFYDGHTLPFDSDSFDGVLLNEVLEHVFNPDEFLMELRRVLRPGGQILLTVPFAWIEHEKPFDYARYTSFGLKSLLEKNGFIVLRQEKIGTGVTAIFQLKNAYWDCVIPYRPLWLRYMLVMTIGTWNNLWGLLLSKLLPNQSDYYLDQVVLGRRPERQVANSTFTHN